MGYEISKVFSLMMCEPLYLWALLGHYYLFVHHLPYVCCCRKAALPVGNCEGALQMMTNDDSILPIDRSCAFRHAGLEVPFSITTEILFEQYFGAQGTTVRDLFRCSPG
jgi:hypothetical protein